MTSWANIKTIRNSRGPLLKPIFITCFNPSCPPMKLLRLVEAPPLAILKSIAKINKNPVSFLKAKITRNPYPPMKWPNLKEIFNFRKITASWFRKEVPSHTKIPFKLISSTASSMSTFPTPNIAPKK